MTKVGILATSEATERNLEHVLFRISGILADEFEVDILGGDAYSSRIKEQRNIYFANTQGIMFRLPGTPGRFFRKFLTLYRYCREEKPDVIMTLSGIGMNGFIVAAVGLLTGTRSINRVTSDMYEVYKYKRPLAKSLRLYLKNNIFGHIAVKLAYRTILLHKGQLETFLDKGFSKDHFFAVSQPLEFPDFKKLSPDEIEADRSRLGMGEAGQVIGVIGRMDQDKNLGLLQDVILSLLDRAPDTWFLLIGSGAGKKQLESRLHGKNCVFVEQVPRDELAAWYQLCDCVLQTSFSEGLSSVIGEALFFGVPVVASDSGAITRSLLSNICYSKEEFVEMITSRSYILDSYPEELEIEHVKAAWKQLIREVAG